MNILTPLSNKVNGEDLLGQAREMVVMVEQAAQNGLPAHKVEETIFRSILEMGRHAFGMFFQLCGTGDEGENVILGGGHAVHRLDNLHQREYLSIFGCYAINRSVYGTREGQKIEHVPLDARLELPESKFSYLLQDWDQSLVMEEPFAKVNSTIKKILGFPQSVNSLERSNRKISTSVQAYWASQASPPAAQEGSLMICQADGKGVPIRGTIPAPPIEDLQGSKGPKPGRKKMALVGAAYTIDPHKRSPEEVMESLFRKPGEYSNPLIPRPEPQFKRIRASLIRDASGTSQPSYDEIFDWLAGEVTVRNPEHHKPTILLMDGQDSLWKAGEKKLSGGETIEILDLIHVISYVWKAASQFHPTSSNQAFEIVEEHVSWILSGDVAVVITDLELKIHFGKIKGKKRKEIEQVCRYFRNNCHRMAYGEFLAAGYPVASGVIEGACRNLVKDRMERSGMRWVLSGAHSMLGLRCIHLNEDWDGFMQFRIHQENKRLYPWRTANDEDTSREMAA